MKKIFLLFSLFALILPSAAKAQFNFPSGNLIIITNTSLDGVFDYSFKEDFHPYDELDSFQIATSNGTGSHTYNFLAAFPNDYRISQALVPNLELTISCTSETNASSFVVVLREARINLTDGDTVTCTFTNTPQDQKNNLLIIPGIMGTEMFKGNERLWAEPIRMLATPNDRFLDDLAYSANAEPINNEAINGEVIGNPNGAYNYTEKLITDLHTQGYTDNQNLFLFPYDWRRELSATANNELKNKLDELLANNNGNKIDIIAHSQGVLVIKKLLLDHPEYQDKIDKLIFVGTPHLGAPKAAKALLYGDSMNVSFLGMGLDPEEIKRIGLHMPSVYELLPSDEYFNHYPGYLGEARKDGLFGEWNLSLYNK